MLKFQNSCVSDYKHLSNILPLHSQTVEEVKNSAKILSLGPSLMVMDVMTEMKDPHQGHSPTFLGATILLLLWDKILPGINFRSRTSAQHSVPPFLGSCSVSVCCLSVLCVPGRSAFAVPLPNVCTYLPTSWLQIAQINCSMLWRETGQDPAVGLGSLRRVSTAIMAGKIILHWHGLCFLPQLMWHGWPSLTCI